MVERLLYTQDVGGSSPSLPTSLRSRSGRRRALRPRASARQATPIGVPCVIYVYIFQRLKFPERYYVGVTHDLRSLLRKHNADEVSHTSKYAPWTIKTYVAFSDERQAIAFEKYLKSASDLAFAKKLL